MLGQVLSRQAEEEERQRREVVAAAAAAVVPAPADNASNTHDTNIVGGRNTSSNVREGEGRYGSIRSDTSDAFVVYDDDNRHHHDDHDDDDDESDSDSEGDSFFNESDHDHSDDDSDDDSHDGILHHHHRHHDDNEESYLLAQKQKRRRKRRRQKQRQQQQTNNSENQQTNQQQQQQQQQQRRNQFHKWKKYLRRKARKIGSKLRAAIVAIADVDNVWDSPDANGGMERSYYEDGTASIDNTTNTASPSTAARRNSSSINSSSRLFNGSGTTGNTGAAGSTAGNSGSNNGPTSFGRMGRDRGASPNNNIASNANHNNNTYNNNNNNNNINNINNNYNSRSSIIYNAITGGTTTHNRTAALFWFLLLSFSYASERSTFKLIVDRVGPFRLFSAELIVGAHALLIGVGLMGGAVWKKELKEFGSGGSGIGGGGGSGGYFDRIEGVGGLGIPLADVGLMAVFDTIYLLLGVISGAHVPPVLTVILVQTTIPLTALFTQCVHPDGRCTRRLPDESNELSPSSNSNPNSRSPDGASSTHNIRIISDSNDTQSINADFPDISSIPNLPMQPPPPVKGWGGLSRYHIIGTGLLTLAILIGLTPAVLSLDHIVITKKDAIPDRTAYNTIVYCLAAIPAAMSQLYKEHTLTRIRQPIDRNQLNMVLSVFQLLFAIVVSPLAYGLQGMGDGPGWTTLYPSKQIGENFSNGLYCFIGTLDEETMKHGYPEEAECDWAWLLVLLHVLSIVMVGVAIDKLAAATKVMYRGVSMGIMIAVLFMFIYQIRDKWCEYGPLVNCFHFISTVVLIVGAEIYHRVSLADSTFETVYPEIGDLYEDED